MVRSSKALENLAIVLEQWQSHPNAMSCAENAAVCVMWAAGSSGKRQLAIANAHDGRIVKALLNIVGTVVPGDEQWIMSGGALGNICGRSMQEDSSVARVIVEANGSAAILNRLEMLFGHPTGPDEFEAVGTLVLHFLTGGLLQIVREKSLMNSLALQLLGDDDGKPSLEVFDLLSEFTALLCGAAPHMNVSHSSRGLSIAVQLHQTLEVLYSMDRDNWNKYELVERFAVRTTRGNCTLYWLLSFCYGQGASFSHENPRALGILKKDWLLAGLRSPSFHELHHMEEERSQASGMASTNETPLQVCAAEGCGNTSLGHGTLLHCKGCTEVLYCGRECQLKDWPRHKAVCKRNQGKTTSLEK